MALGNPARVAYTSPPTGTLSFGTLTAVTLGAMPGTTAGFSLPLVNANLAAVALSLGNSSADATLFSILSGSGSVIKVGNDTLVLAGADGYSGGTTVTAGTLRMSNASALGATTGTLTVNGGTLDLNGNNLTVGPLGGSGGTITGNGTLTSNFAGVSSFAGVITGGASFVKQGSGLLTLSGNNNSAAARRLRRPAGPQRHQHLRRRHVLNGGELSISSEVNIGGATVNLVFNGGLLQITGTALTD